MRNLTKRVFSLMIISGVVFNLSAQTIKERIDEAKTVKVYISIKDVTHVPNTTAAPGSQQKGTGCVLFDKTTPFPASYTDEVNLVVEMLNKGFNTTAFVAADISTVPLVETGMLKGNPDWIKLGEPIVFIVYLSGSYNVTNVGLMGEVKLSNNLSILSGIGVNANVGGKMKALAVKNLGMVGTPSKESKTCGDYDYFVQNFPLADFFDKFKESFEKKMVEFTTKEMEDYDKAMKKKK
jgi:hypothetical protein